MAVRWRLNRAIPVLDSTSPMLPCAVVAAGKTVVTMPLSPLLAPLTLEDVPRLAQGFARFLGQATASWPGGASLGGSRASATLSVMGGERPSFADRRVAKEAVRRALELALGVPTTLSLEEPKVVGRWVVVRIT